MSINNLADQLKWLLTSRTFLPPPAPTPTSTVEELPDGFGEDDTLNSFEDSAAEERQDAKLPKDIVARDTLLQAISYDTLENNPDMARLRTPASPAHRPPLQDIPSVEEMCEHPRTSRSRYFSPVAEQENRDPHGVTQTKSVSSHPVSAPRPQVSRGESRNQLRASSPSKPVPNSIHPQNRHILIPILDTIDLTEDDETFAPQNPKINTVSYPDLDPARSSRKRKSEDYEADLHVKSKRFNSPVKVATPPITQSIEQSPHRKPQPQTIQVFKQDVDDTRYFSESSDAHEDESLVLLGHNSLRKPSVSIKTTKLPPLETHNYDQSPSPVRQASVKEEWKSSVVKEQPPPANDLAHAKHAIADSEDEEALEVMMELEQEDVTMEDTIKTGLEEISEKHESPPLPSIPDSQRQKDRASVHMSQPASNLIQSPAFLPREARIGNTQPALGTTDHNGILEVFKTTNDTVKQLALFTMADIDEYKLFLQAEHTQAINAATQAFCDGEDLSGFQAEKRRLQAQLQACDVLLDLWNAQCLLSARHTMLKQKIMKAVEADLDPDPALAVAVKALRQEIAEGEQGLTQQVNRSGFDVNSKEPLVEEPKSTYKVAVKGTQLPTRTPHEDFSSSSRTVFGTQAIKQTQAPVPRSREIFEHPAPMRDTYNRPKSPSRRVQPARHDRESYVPTFAQDPRPMANNNGQSRFQNYGDRQEVRRVESTSYHDLIDDADDFDDVDEMEMSNVMGTPPNRNAADDDNDDFGFDDDEEMLEVADDLDMRPTKNQKDRSTKVREVLPAASANPRTKHVALPGVRNKEKVSLPPLDIKDDDHRWSKDMKSALKKVFKLSGFRPNQQAAINATLGGKDVFVLMPTGGGKSLCYQLPAVVKTGRTRGVTIVVSPLLSLMEDQVSHLQSLGVQAMMINSSSSPDEKKLIMNALRGPDPETFIQLLYVTPEMLSKNLGLVEILKNLHRNKKFARIVIDEAHCVSQWGHDFRPDYKALGEVRRQFVGVPVIALTATATENVKLDVISNLGIDGCEVFMQSFNRPNLIYEVRPKKPKMILSEMAEIIAQDYDGETGIIYCLARKKCEEVAEQLQKQHNIRAMHYHADMSPDEKSRVQHAWQSGEYQVIVATIAFGMGIDKGNVRFVMHHTLPKSLEGYYQETGRAGRDGKQSGCYLFYSYADCSTLKRMIEDGDGSYDQKQRQKQMLRRVVQFCENRIDCRRVQVLSYFNETFTSEACHKSCDNCNSMSIFEEQDFTSQATDAIKFVEAVLQKSRQDVRDSHQSDKNEKRFTLLQLVDMFRGVKKDYNEDIELHGVGSELSKTTAERLFQRLLTDEALQELNVLNKGGFASQYIRLGKSAQQFLDGRRKVIVQIRISTSPMQTSKASKKKTAKVKKLPPMSTNVSSPAPQCRRSKTKVVDDEDEDEDEAVHSHSRARPNMKKPAHDDFMVSDEDDEDYADDGFEEVRERDQPARRGRRGIGAPINTDQKMAKLDGFHRDFVHAFVTEATKLGRKLMAQKDLRDVPFSDTMLREIGLSLPQTKDALIAIPGIDAMKVDQWSKNYLTLTREYQKRYNDIMNEESRVFDPNHQIVDLVSDDENAFAGDDAFSDEEQGSRFFPGGESQNNAATANFNRQVAEAAASRSAAQSVKASQQASRKRQGGDEYSGGSRKRASGSGGKKGFKQYANKEKKSNTGSGRGGGGGTAHGSKPSNTANMRKSRGLSTGGGAQRTFSGTGIGMMPT